MAGATGWNWRREMVAALPERAQPVATLPGNDHAISDFATRLPPVTGMPEPARPEFEQILPVDASASPRALDSTGHARTLSGWDNRASTLARIVSMFASTVTPASFLASRVMSKPAVRCRSRRGFRTTWCESRQRAAQVRQAGARRADRQEPPHKPPTSTWTWCGSGPEETSF